MSYADEVAKAVDEKRNDAAFMERVSRAIERNRGVLDRLAANPAPTMLIAVDNWPDYTTAEYVCSWQDFARLASLAADVEGAERQPAKSDQSVFDDWANVFMTHWFGCWKEPTHHECAVAMIERAGKLFASVLEPASTDDLDVIEQRIKDYQLMVYGLPLPTFKAADEGETPVIKLSTRCIQGVHVECEGRAGLSRDCECPCHVEETP